MTDLNQELRPKVSAHFSPMEADIVIDALDRVVIEHENAEPPRDPWRVVAARDAVKQAKKVLWLNCPSLLAQRRGQTEDDPDLLDVVAELAEPDRSMKHRPKHARRRGPRTGNGSSRPHPASSRKLRAE